MAQNLFSFEFYTRDADGNPKKRLGEYYFLTGPQSYKEQFRYRVSIEPVFGGGVAVTDFGTDQNPISLQGEFYIKFKARPPEPIDPYSPGLAANDALAGGVGVAAGKTLDFAKQQFENFIRDSVAEFFPIAGVNTRSGEMEFQDFVGLLYGLRQESGYVSHDAQGQEITRAFVGKQFNFAEYALIYNDYARFRRVEVVIPKDGFSISRSVEDTNTYKYSLELVVVRDMSPREQEVPNALDQVLGLNPFAVMNGLVSMIDTMIRLPLVATDVALRMASAFKRFTELGGDISESWSRMRDQFNEDGKLARSTFQSAVDNVKDVLGFENRKSMWDRVANQANQNKKLMKDATEAEYRLRYTLGSYVANIEDAIYNLGGFLIAMQAGQSLEGNSLQPGADYTRWFTHPLYELFLQAYSDAITLEAEFIKAGSDTNFKVYNAIGGDSFPSIAALELGDQKLAGALAAYNGMDVNSGIEGVTIKIPFARKMAIFAKMGPVTLAKDLERALLGEDLALTPTRDLEVAPNGDLAVVEGEVALLNNIVDIIDTEQGSLPQYDWFGNPTLIGETMDVGTRASFVPKLLNAIRADPRVESAVLNQVYQDGNTIKYLISVRSIYGGTPFFLEALPRA